jgi:hypothetical protein
MAYPNEANMTFDALWQKKLNSTPAMQGAERMSIRVEAFKAELQAAFNAGFEHCQATAELAKQLGEIEKKPTPFKDLFKGVFGQ